MSKKYKKHELTIKILNLTVLDVHKGLYFQYF